MGKSDFEILLDRIEDQYGKMKSHMEAARWFWKNGNAEAAMERAMKLEELSEKYILNCRALPLYTDNPQAKASVGRTIAECVPVQMGYTEEGWFGIRMEPLAKTKDTASKEYIRGIIYPAMRRFFADKATVRYPDCTLIFRHVYDRNIPGAQYRDYDNVEVKMVTDTVAMYVMVDDSPLHCRTFHCCAPGKESRTEVYVVPQNDFKKWCEMEDSIPDEGMPLSPSLPDAWKVDI